MAIVVNPSLQRGSTVSQSTRFITTLTASACVLPILNPVLHIVYLTFVFAALFVCGMVLAHCGVQAYEAGAMDAAVCLARSAFDRTYWAVRNGIGYLDPSSGAFWITGLGGQVLDFFDPESDSIRYF